MRLAKMTLLLALLSGCGPSSLADLQCEGEILTRKLALELRAIDDKEELQRATPRLKKRFNRLANLLVQVRSFQKEEMEPTLASEELFSELARLYEIPGCRELIETAQLEAVQKLD